MREDERYALAGDGTLVDEVYALPDEVIESVEPPLPGTPVELIGPVRHTALQPVQLGALFPTYIWDLVWPSGMTQTHP